MRGKSTLLGFALCLVGGAPAWAGLLDQFTGFQTINEIGVSGLRSSYYNDTVNNHAISGGMTSTTVATLGPNRVSYPNGVGGVPSPGGSLGAHFDLGVMGIQVNSGQVTVRVASRLNPLTGFRTGGVNYGIGDMFMTVQDGVGLRQYGLLSTWARNGSTALSIGGGGSANNAARTFHTTGGGGGTSLEGHLVRLNSDSNVVLTGGTNGYSPSSAPNGLDVRAFARSGTDLGSANLVNSSVVDSGVTWYLETWRFNLGSVSAQNNLTLGWHITYNCGNDQTGGTTHVAAVPSPESTLLGGLGMVALAVLRRRMA